jgi:hypothetical protein
MANIKTKIYALLGRASKKTVIVGSIIAILIIVLVLGVLAANWKIKAMSSAGYFNSSKSGRMMGPGISTMIYPSLRYNNINEFITPQDAAKTGELAVIVDSLDNARNSIAEVATKNGGSIYTTLISYLSGSIKNGSIVVQVPAENFDAAFSDLKKIGSQVVQESTKQIPLQNIIYPQPLSMPATGAENAPTAVSSSASAVQSEGPTTASVAMMPSYKQIAQDKGYIRVVFADLAKNTNRMNISSIVGVGYSGLNMRSNRWVVLAIKSILLIVLIAVLLIIAKKIHQNLKKSKQKRTANHGVRQAVKTRTRIIRIKRK